MTELISRETRINSLPKLGSFAWSETKLFKNRDVLAQTKKIFLDRFNDKDK